MALVANFVAFHLQVLTRTPGLSQFLTSPPFPSLTVTAQGYIVTIICLISQTSILVGPHLLTPNIDALYFI